MKFCSSSEFTSENIFPTLPDLKEQKSEVAKYSLVNGEKFLNESSVFDYSVILQFEHIIDTLTKLMDLKFLSTFISNRKVIVSKPHDEKNTKLEIVLLHVYNSLFHVVCKNVSNPIRLSKFTLSPFTYEYNISLFTINHLRKISPHFGYTFGKLTSLKNNVSILQEYIQGDTLSSFLYKRIDKKNTRDLSEQFLSIFVQTITGLEVAQQSLQFTHHDFHFDNLIIRKIARVEPYIHVKVFQDYYHFQNFGLCPTIIDFERSTSRYKKDCIFVNAYMDHLKYGYLGIFVPGVDIVRFLFSVYAIVMITEAKKQFHSFGFKIFNFIEYIFQYLYKIKSPVMQKEAFKYHSQHYFNTTHFPQIFLTPYDLLEFMKEHETMICKIFNVPSYPWTVTESPFPKDLKDYEKRKKKAFSQVFCLDQLYHHREKYLYSFMNDDIVQISEKDFILWMDKIMKDYEYPSLNPEHILYLQKFYEDHSFLIPTYEYYFMHFFIKKDGIGKLIFASKNSAVYTRIYRTLSSIYAFLLLQSRNENVLAEMKKFNREKVIYISTKL